MAINDKCTLLTGSALTKRSNYQLRHDSGATLLEYALGLALIILILVWSYRGFLQSVDNKYENNLNQLNQVGPVPLLNIRP